MQPLSASKAKAMGIGPRPPELLMLVSAEVTVVPLVRVIAAAAWPTTTARLADDDLQTFKRHPLTIVEAERSR